MDISAMVLWEKGLAPVRWFQRRPKRCRGRNFLQQLSMDPQTEDGACWSRGIQRPSNIVYQWFDLTKYPTIRVWGEKLWKKSVKESRDQHSPKVRVLGVKYSDKKKKTKNSAFSLKKNEHLKSVPASHALGSNQQFGLGSARQFFFWF